MAEAEKVGDSLALANFCRDKILEDMVALREPADTLETLTGAQCWPFPSYGELLYGVK